MACLGLYCNSFLVIWVICGQGQAKEVAFYLFCVCNLWCVPPIIAMLPFMFHGLFFDAKLKLQYVHRKCTRIEIHLLTAQGLQVSCYKLHCIIIFADNLLYHCSYLYRFFGISKTLYFTNEGSSSCKTLSWNFVLINLITVVALVRKSQTLSSTFNIFVEVFCEVEAELTCWLRKKSFLIVVICSLRRNQGLWNYRFLIPPTRFSATVLRRYCEALINFLT